MPSHATLKTAAWTILIIAGISRVPMARDLVFGA